MCVTSEETSSADGSTTVTFTSNTGVEHLAVTAPRIALDVDLWNGIDWSKVAPLTVIGAISGVFNGLPGMTLGSVLGTATAIETQTGITNLFQIEYDMLTVPGLPAPYIPLF